MVHPSVFSESHPNCTAIKLPGYSYELDMPFQPVHLALWRYPNAYDVQKSEGQSWEYLLGPRKMGSMGSLSRGKQLAIWAGHVCSLCHG